MPTISMFLGIVVRMYYDDHNPPHFHAYYGEHAAIIAIETLEILEGQLPKRAQALVMEWAEMNKAALLENWKLAAEHQPLKPIKPLE